MLKNNFVNALYLFALFPIVPNKFKGLLVAIVFLCSLTGSFNKDNIRQFLLLSSLFILFTVSLLYSDNYYYGYKKLETLLSCLIIPAGFLLFKKDEIETFDKTVFIKIFIHSVLIFSVLVIICFLNSDEEYYLNWFVNKIRIVSSEVPLIGQSSTYAALYALISIVLNTELFFQKKIRKKEKVYYIIVLFFQTGFLFLIQNRTLLLCFFIFLFYTLLKSKIASKRKIFFSILILSALTLLTISNRRMNELIKFGTYHTEEGHKYFSTNIRVKTLKCSLDLIKKAPVFGYGVGDAQKALNICHTKAGIKMELNSHNQYIDIILKTGIFGAVVFIFSLILLLRHIFLSAQEVFILIISIFLFLFLTENLLSRQTGAILFYFFTSLPLILKKPRSNEL